MMNLGLIALAAVFLVPVSSLAGEIRYVGSSTVGRFIADAARIYERSTFDIHVKPESQGGERCPRLGTCDLGGVARELDGAALNNGVVGTLIGRDAIAVIVHPENPVQELTREQVRGIFTGRIRTWAEVGGLKIPITPHIVDWNSATRHVFQEALLDGRPYGGCEIAVPDPRVIREVARNIGAIGHISASFLTKTTGVRPVPIDGQAPEPGNAGYPVMRPLYLTTAGQPRGEVKKFIQWALSEAGQQVVRKRFAGL